MDDVLQSLTDLLSRDTPATQQQICQKLAKLGHPVNQSTVSRLLRKLQAVKAADEQGRTVYRLPSDAAPMGREVAPGNPISGMVRSMQSNGNLVVVLTTPGSASLVGKYIDNHRPANILGCLAGDDTVFVAPSTSRVLPSTLDALRTLLLSE